MLPHRKPKQRGRSSQTTASTYGKHRCGSGRVQANSTKQPQGLTVGLSISSAPGSLDLRFNPMHASSLCEVLVQVLRADVARLGLKAPIDVLAWRYLPEKIPRDAYVMLESSAGHPAGPDEHIGANSFAGPLLKLDEEAANFGRPSLASWTTA